MKSIMMYFSKNRQVIMTVFWIAIVMAVAFLYFVLFKTENPVINIKLLYYLSFAVYLSIGFVLFQKLDERNVFGFIGKFFSKLIIVNIILMVILLIGFILHFFLNDSSIFMAILSKPIPWSIIILFVLTWAGDEFIYINKKKTSVLN